MNRLTTLVALTEKGKQLAEQLLAQMPNTQLLFKPKPFTETVQTLFTHQHRLIMICSTGIAVRTLGPVLNNKRVDPPVLIMDEAGKYVIPLLSGHEGGANEWANQIADSFGITPVITTAKSYLNPTYTVGMGCERGCPQHHLIELLFTALRHADLHLQDIASINSIDIKADEIGLTELAKSINRPFQTFNKKALSRMEPLLSCRSDYVFKTVGVYGVAESAALLAAELTPHHQPELYLNKIKTDKATCAIARSFAVEELKTR